MRSILQSLDRILFRVSSLAAFCVIFCAVVIGLRAVEALVIDGSWFWFVLAVFASLGFTVNVKRVWWMVRRSEIEDENLKMWEEADE